MTRLMTIGLDGCNLRCLGQGSLSHYDWKDDNHIYIFGRTGSSVDAMRNNPIMSIPIVMYSLRFAKKMVKMVIGKNKGIVGGASFLMIEDCPEANATAFAKDVIPTDGHPMTNPQNRDWCICDNYPDAEGYRDLFLYNFNEDTRINLGRFKRMFDNPDMAMKEHFFTGIDEKILKTVSEKQIAFT